MGLFRHARNLAAASFGALLLSAYPAHAQTITNTAQASWVQEGASRSRESNTVRFEREGDVATVQTLHFPRSTNGGSDSSIARCGDALPPSYAGDVNQTPGNTEATGAYRIGEDMIVALGSPRANISSDVIDRLQVTLTTTAGDREDFNLYETAPDSGRFLGAIQVTRWTSQSRSNDCHLDVNPNDTVMIAIRPVDGSRPIAAASANILADPFGVVFDSNDGQPVNGARVSVVDAVTGRPVPVFADDGVTPWPSSVVTGRSVTDAAGTVYPMGAGEYRFPLMAYGTYRLVVDPPAPYTAPSTASPAALAALNRIDGEAFEIIPASYGNIFEINSPVALRVDIPVDRPDLPLSLTKTASVAQAVPGEVVFFTINLSNVDTAGSARDITVTDTPSPWLRLRRDSVMIDGAAAGDAVEIAPDGSTFSFAFATLAPGETRTIRYAMSVRQDAPAGVVTNRVDSTDFRGVRVTTSVPLRIETDILGNRVTIIGQVTAGECTANGSRRGVPGVRVMMEDGSFAVTDQEGRYHLDGVTPGTHVVQAIRQTLPDGGEFVDCTRSTRSAGSANSRFIAGRGGDLITANFHAVIPGFDAIAGSDVAPDGETAIVAAGSEVTSPTAELVNGDGAVTSPQPVAASGTVIAETVARTPAQLGSDAAAAGAGIDFLAMGDGPHAFLFPDIGHNPRAPAIRVAIRHEVTERVELSINGELVGPLSFDGREMAADRSFAVSVWRGIPLAHEVNRLHAVIRDADGGVVVELEREVDFSAAPARAELVSTGSNLVADGATNPVVAVRITDRRGRPVRAGVSGAVTLSDPYQSAASIERERAAQLAGPGSRSGPRPTWTIEGDDGIALIELAPTMVSGPLQLRFEFRDRDTTRVQELESWVTPGEQEWTLIGLAEGGMGAQSIADNMERSGALDSDLGDNARVAFYARGQILGSVLLTVAYDSAAQRDDSRLFSAIDPAAYYTVYADGSNRQFDAASREKLYIRLESDNFYAIYGDILTGFDQTQLARYERSATGVAVEGRLGAFHAQAFAAEIASNFRRDEFQGGGISGPYSLSSRAIIPNSERVAIEVRDRFRSEIVIDRIELVRFVDYDIDLLSGTITFAQPVISRDAELNPRIVIVEYEIDELAGTGDWNGGVRADVTLADGDVRIGASLLSDGGNDTQSGRTNIAAVDARVQLGSDTEIRAEAAMSRTDDGAEASAWLLEAEHHSGSLDLLAYIRSIDSLFGTGQQSLAERGRRKFGIDARLTATENLIFTAHAWRDDSLTSARRRDALGASGSYRTTGGDYTLAITHFSDRRADLSEGSSTVLEGGVTQRFLDNRLQLGVSTSVGLGGTDSIDLPTRHRLDARFALNSDLRLLAQYEIAEGDAVSARTLRGGIEATAWEGSRMTGTLGQQIVRDRDASTFAAFGLSQTVQLSETITVDASIDHSRTLSGGDPGDIINPEQPVSSGGNLIPTGALLEDFTAATLGMRWRLNQWSASLRGEYRDGEFAERRGLTFAAIRQLDNGSAVGAGATWTRADAADGASTQIIDASLALAHRPADSEFAMLTKIEYRSDEVVGATAGQTGPVGSTALTVTGDAVSRRVIGSISANYAPRQTLSDGNGFAQRSEFTVFTAGRYNLDQYEGLGYEGFTGVVSLDARIGMSERVELGTRVTVRHAFADATTDWAIGPYVGFVPADDVLLSVGYNFAGFRDEDFEVSRDTREGVFASIRVKFDASTFGFLFRD